METDIEDNLSTPNSWIPLKALKKLMGIKDPSKPMLMHEDVPPLHSYQEDIPNKCINSSSSFEKLHNKYKNSYKIPDTHNPAHLNPINTDQYIQNLENKLYQSQKEVFMLKTRLKVSQNKNMELNKLISTMQTDFMIKIQNMQEQHERKLYKTKQDIDYLLKEMNNKSNLIILNDFIKIHLSEIEKCKQNYEDIIKSFIKQSKKKDHKSNKEYMFSVSHTLEQKLDIELNNLRERYENQIEKLKELVTTESLEAYYEDEISTGLNSERATSELKGSILENTLKVHSKGSKSKFFQN
jgi:hypothetical protein